MRRTIMAVMVAVMAITVPIGEAAALCGDVSGDGRITSKDVRKLKKAKRGQRVNLTCECDEEHTDGGVDTEGPPPEAGTGIELLLYNALGCRGDGPPYTLVEDAWDWEVTAVLDGPHNEWRVVTDGQETWEWPYSSFGSWIRIDFVDWCDNKSYQVRGAIDVPDYSTVLVSLVESILPGGLAVDIHVAVGDNIQFLGTLELIEL